MALVNTAAVNETIWYLGIFGCFVAGLFLGFYMFRPRRGLTEVA